MSTTTIDTPVAADFTVYADGQFRRLSEVAFRANTQALNYGTGTFEGIRAYWDDERARLNLLRAGEHYERFLGSARTLRMDVGATVDDLVAITEEVIRRNDFRQDVYVRPLLLKRSLMPGERFGVKLRGVDSTLCINALPMGRYAATPQFRCVVSKWQRVPDAAIPSSAKITGTYVNSALAYEDARDQGADDAILLNADGDCAEATTSNVFIVKDGRVLTPPLGAGILNGVTRDCVLQLCRHLGIPAAEARITREDLRQADQCFLTGTGIEVRTVTELDGRPLAHDESTIAARLAFAYEQAVRGRDPAFAAWLRPVQEGRGR